MPMLPIAQRHVPIFNRQAQISGGDVLLQESGSRLLLEAGGPVLRDSSTPAQSVASTLDGSEYVTIVQAGTTKRISTAALAAYVLGG